METKLAPAFLSNGLHGIELKDTEIKLPPAFLSNGLHGIENINHTTYHNPPKLAGPNDL